MGGQGEPDHGGLGRLPPAPQPPPFLARGQAPKAPPVGP